MADEAREFIIRYSGELTRETKVELFDKELYNSINEIICDLLGERLDEEEPVQRKWLFDELEDFNIDKPAPAEIVILNNDNLAQGVVHCTLTSLQSKLTSLQSKVNRYVEEQGKKIVFCPNKSELCVVADRERNWQRAAMIDPKRGNVFSIDFGTVLEVPAEDIRRFHDDLAEPLYAHQCQIVDVPDNLSKQMLNELQNRLGKGEVIKVSKITKTGKIFELHMPELIFEVFGL